MFKSVPALTSAVVPFGRTVRSKYTQQVAAMSAAAVTADTGVLPTPYVPFPLVQSASTLQGTPEVLTVAVGVAKETNFAPMIN